MLKAVLKKSREGGKGSKKETGMYKQCEQAGSHGAATLAHSRLGGCHCIGSGSKECSGLGCT